MNYPVVLGWMLHVWLSSCSPLPAAFVLPYSLGPLRNNTGDAKLANLNQTTTHSNAIGLLMVAMATAIDFHRTHVFPAQNQASPSAIA